MKVIRMVFSILIVLAICSSAAWASPYATTLVDSGGAFGGSPYDDPESVLGAPATDFYDPWGSWSGGTNDRRVKLVEPAYNTDADGNKLITTLRDYSYIVVAFDHQVYDDPNNPWGIDFLVFGNAFYTGSGFVNDGTDMNTYMLVGGGWFEDVLISVSQDGETWYTYENGPYGDNAFPTQAYQWDAENAQWTDELMDFTRPVNPAYYDMLMNGGLSAAEAIALYNGSGGGTGFDLAESGFEWIQYIKVEGITGFAEGEIDAFADVAPVPIPAAIWLLGSGLIGLVGIRRRNS